MSFDKPMPAITPWIVSPCAIASLKRLSTNAAPPSPTTSPSARASNGRSGQSGIVPATARSPFACTSSPGREPLRKHRVGAMRQQFIACQLQDRVQRTVHLRMTHRSPRAELTPKPSPCRDQPPAGKPRRISGIAPIRLHFGWKSPSCGPKTSIVIAFIFSVGSAMLPKMTPQRSRSTGSVFAFRHA